MKSIFTIIFSLVITAVVNAQIYDVLVTESFDNTTNLSTDGTFGNDGNSAGGGFIDAFDVSANFGSPSNVTSYVTYETSSVFVGGDVDGYGGTTPSYLEVFNYTVDHDDEVGFVGDFALPAGCTGLDYASGDIDILNTDIVKNNTISGVKIFPYVMSKDEIHDIDNLKDLELIKN